VSATEALRRSVTIVNKRGLHARAAAKFVKLSESFDADITVSKGGVEVSGLSIMGLMMLAAAPGCSIDVTTRGPEAAAAMAALEELVAGKFGEE
jgi:phosphocarrier protein HPr